jgi:hypothetical protein
MRLSLTLKPWTKTTAMSWLLSLLAVPTSAFVATVPTGSGLQQAASMFNNTATGWYLEPDNQYILMAQVPVLTGYS